MVTDQIIRARLIKANGRADNQIIWRSGSTSGVNMVALSLDLLNRWLDAIVNGSAPLSADKVVSKKPFDAVDTCWDLGGNKIAEAGDDGQQHAMQQNLPLFQPAAAQSRARVDPRCLEVRPEAEQLRRLYGCLFDGRTSSIAEHLPEWRM